MSTSSSDSGGHSNNDHLAGGKMDALERTGKVLQRFAPEETTSAEEKKNKMGDEGKAASQSSSHNQCRQSR